MTDNMWLYNAVRGVPDAAKKAITGGRLKGMTDVNPMWRIKALTEQFGPCGKGWRYTIENLWTEAGNEGETIANALINLYITVDGVESAPIPGIGGAMLVVKEKNGLYTDDEAYKKALTDAISVACKALGVGADVYWDKDPTKYTERAKPAAKAPPELHPLHCADCGQTITGILGQSGNPISAEKLVAISQSKYNLNLCAACQATRKAAAELQKKEGMTYQQH